MINQIKIIHANPNGIAYKNKSLQRSVDKYEANVVTLNETKSIPQRIKGFGAWYHKPRVSREGGSGNSSR